MPQQQQVGQRVLEELLVPAAADVDLDGEAQIAQPKTVRTTVNQNKKS